jgi:DivIVA domain-containing protein
MAADPNSDETSTQRFVRSASASERLREVTFPVVMRGYDRHAVDQFLSELATLVDELESRQTREGVVQKALDELGEETAGILQRAHETADEISSRSRAQADTRLQRAEREAEILRRDADEYAEQVIVDTRVLWEERQRLIEDIRQLADEVLGTADDAMERLKLPEQLGSASEPAPEGLAPDDQLPASEGPTAVAPLPADDGSRLDDGPALDDRAGLDDGAGLEEAPGLDEAPTLDERASFDQQAALDDAEAPLPFDDREDEAVEESGHTVELEALPGGSEEPPEHERR